MKLAICLVTYGRGRNSDAALTPTRPSPRSSVG